MHNFPISIQDSGQKYTLSSPFVGILLLLLLLLWKARRNCECKVSSIAGHDSRWIMGILIDYNSCFFFYYSFATVVAFHKIDDYCPASKIMGYYNDNFF